MKDGLDREYSAAPSGGGQLLVPEEGAEPLWQLTEEVRDHAIVLLDPQGTVASWHDGARAITGHEAHEIVGTHFSRFYLPEAVETGWPELELRVAAVEGRFAGAGWRLRQDGSHYWAEVVLTALRDRGGALRGFGHVIRDTSQRQRAKPLPGVARQTNEFVAMLSHELRNPLAPIRTAVHLLRRKHLNDTDVPLLVAMLDRNSAHLVRLLDDLLDVSRLTYGTIRLHSQVLDIASVVARAVEASRPVIDAHRHTLCLALPEEPVQLSGDCVRLAQVIGELLHNAARYTPPGGEIRITVMPLERQVEIHVRDTGIGMAPELMARAFDLFTRGEGPLARSAGGLGIGLALARGLVELHGGYLEVHSAGRDKGSEFLMRLPVSPAAPAVAAEGRVDGVRLRRRTREVDASPQTGLERHFVKPRYWAELRRLLSCFQPDAACAKSAAACEVARWNYSA